MLLKALALSAVVVAAAAAATPTVPPPAPAAKPPESHEVCNWPATAAVQLSMAQLNALGTWSDSGQVTLEMWHTFGPTLIPQFKALHDSACKMVP